MQAVPNTWFYYVRVNLTLDDVTRYDVVFVFIVRLFWRVEGRGKVILAVFLREKNLLEWVIHRMFCPGIYKALLI